MGCQAILHYINLHFTYLLNKLATKKINMAGKYLAIFWAQDNTQRGVASEHGQVV